MVEAHKMEVPTLQNEADYDSTQFDVSQTEEMNGLSVGKNANGETVKIKYKAIELDALGVGESRKPFTSEQISNLRKIFNGAYKESSETRFSNTFESVADEVVGKGRGFGLLKRIWLMAQSDQAPA